MSTFIITTRNPRTGKVLIGGSFENDVIEVTEFDTEQAARECAEGIKAFVAWGYNVIEVP